ncbi:hypothetical protein ACPPVO_36570 [Dactylosporangium sp. McL0621]|uniref:hypothetical protein n=1 Tax=Dactylosporangium sp. McL0621 TaxID=3415678 RepID=UPI003CEFBCB9
MLINDVAAVDFMGALRSGGPSPLLVAIAAATLAGLAFVAARLRALVVLFRSIEHLEAVGAPVGVPFEDSYRPGARLSGGALRQPLAADYQIPCCMRCASGRGGAVMASSSCFGYGWQGRPRGPAVRPPGHDSARWTCCSFGKSWAG